MRKVICTSTVFAGMLSVIVDGIFIRMPWVVWWDHSASGDYMTKSGETMRLPLWFSLNIMVPVAMVVAVIGIVSLLWRAASAICSKLRGEAEPIGKVKGEQDGPE